MTTGEAMQSARSEVSIDNDRVRVTTWTLARDERTGRHRHELDYVVVPLTAGQLAMTSAGTATSSELTHGGCYFRDAGVEHDVSNPRAQTVAFVEIEIKRPALA
jgi:quercetin dioxygenase-like cupin family protein